MVKNVWTGTHKKFADLQFADLRISDKRVVLGDSDLKVDGNEK
jgi:hypothetical protein